MKVQRSNKFRCYPTTEQQAKLCQYFGAARWVWNTSLAWRSHCYKADGESVSGVDFSRELTFIKRLKPYAWLRDIPATVYAQALRDQDRAFAAFFAKRARYPRFKKRGHAQAIRFQLDQRRIANQFRDGELLKLPGLGAIKVRWSRKVAGTPKMVTLRQDASGRYFVSMMAEVEVTPMPAKAKQVGIDFGLKDIAVTSDGWKSGNPRHLRAGERRLKMVQRRLSRKRKGSNRWHRQRQIVAKQHAEVSDARADWLHKLSTDLIREYGLIALEDLSVKGMQRGRLAKSIGDAALSELRRQLEYKAKWHGRVVEIIDRWAPTTKACSGCGTVRGSVPLNVRTWTCEHCGAEHDRDVNAAKNILALVSSTAGKAGIEARGARTTPEAAAQAA